jgi:hypothetical protein
MFTLSFERSHQVLMVRVGGIFASNDMTELDDAVIRFLSRQHDDASVRGLYDFTEVQAIAVPASKFAERGLRPPIVRGLRILVAPAGASEGFGRSFGNQQRTAGNSEPVVVATLAEAYALLGLDNPYFEAVEQS